MVPVAGWYLLASVPYAPEQDFDFITVGLRSPNVLVVPESSPYKSVADVIAALKANAGRISFGSSGNGSSDHLTAEIFWAQTDTTGLHIPYKGGAPATVDLLASNLNAMFPNVNAVIQYIKAGKLRALAITSESRSPLLPDVPTMAEAGVKDMVTQSGSATHCLASTANGRASKRNQSRRRLTSTALASTGS